MKWRAKDYFAWHGWFAWFPVCIEGRWIWLEKVERKIEWCHPEMISWEYRVPPALGQMAAIRKAE